MHFNDAAEQNIAFCRSCGFRRGAWAAPSGGCSSRTRRGFVRRNCPWQGRVGRYWGRRPPDPRWNRNSEHDWLCRLLRAGQLDAASRRCRRRVGGSHPRSIGAVADCDVRDRDPESVGGKVTSVSGTSVTLSTRKGTQTVLVGPSTTYSQGSGSPTMVSAGEFVAASGLPDPSVPLTLDAQRVFIFTPPSRPSPSKSEPRVSSSGAPAAPIVRQPVQQGTSVEPWGGDVAAPQPQRPAPRNWAKEAVRPRPGSAVGRAPSRADLLKAARAGPMDAVQAGPSAAALVVVPAIDERTLDSPGPCGSRGPGLASFVCSTPHRGLVWGRLKRHKSASRDAISISVR